LSISKRPSWRYRSKASYSLKLLPAADNLVIESQEQAPAIWKGLKERAQELQPKLLPKSTLGQAVNSTRTKQSGRKRNGNWRIAFFLAISFALRMTISNRAAGLVQTFQTFGDRCLLPCDHLRSRVVARPPDSLRRVDWTYWLSWAAFHRSPHSLLQIC